MERNDSGIERKAMEIIDIDCIFLAHLLTLFFLFSTPVFFPKLFCVSVQFNKLNVTQSYPYHPTTIIKQQSPNHQTTTPNQQHGIQFSTSYTRHSLEQKMRTLVPSLEQQMNRKRQPSSRRMPRDSRHSLQDSGSISSSPSSCRLSLPTSPPPSNPAGKSTPLIHSPFWMFPPDPSSKSSKRHTKK